MRMERDDGRKLKRPRCSRTPVEGGVDRGLGPGAAEQLRRLDDVVISVEVGDDEHFVFQTCAVQAQPFA